jgi:1,4-dihydroxy-2-naphthoate octaprenyltransferase
MKSNKKMMMIVGVVLFLAGLIWILVAEGWWLNWLVLVVGVVAFILSFIGKKKAAPVAPVAPVETAPAASTEEPKSEM